MKTVIIGLLKIIIVLAVVYGIYHTWFESSWYGSYGTDGWFTHHGLGGLNTLNELFSLTVKVFFTIIGLAIIRIVLGLEEDVDESK